MHEPYPKILPIKEIITLSVARKKLYKKVSFIRSNLAENSLTQKLMNVIQSIVNEWYDDAINQLNAFINRIEAQRGNKLTNDQVDYLVAEAQAIIDSLQLENNSPSLDNTVQIRQIELPKLYNGCYTCRKNQYSREYSLSLISHNKHTQIQSFLYY